MDTDLTLGIKTALTTTGGIEALQVALLEMEQADLSVEHRFVNGMYTREIIIPKDCTLVGRVHKYPYFDIMLSGDITVSGKDGVKRFKGINIFEGVPGRKRAGYAHEDTRWITVHHTAFNDPDTIVDDLTVMSVDEFNDLDLKTESIEEIAESEFRKQQSYKMSDFDKYKTGFLAAVKGAYCLTEHKTKPEVVLSDYDKVLSEYGFTAEQVRAECENAADQIPMPEGYEHLEVRASEISGNGMYSQLNHIAGEFIAPVRVGGMRTTAGRFVNHSPMPNCFFSRSDDGDLFLFASKMINKGSELTIDYREALNIRMEGELCHQQ